jgi:hypothetical protein
VRERCAKGAIHHMRHPRKVRERCDTPYATPAKGVRNVRERCAKCAAATTSLLRQLQELGIESSPSPYGLNFAPDGVTRITRVTRYSYSECLCYTCITHYRGRWLTQDCVTPALRVTEAAGSHVKLCGARVKTTVKHRHRLCCIAATSCKCLVASMLRSYGPVAHLSLSVAAGCPAAKAPNRSKLGPPQAP